MNDIKSNTGLRVNTPYKQKIHKTYEMSVELAKEELKKVNLEILEDVYNSGLWDKKRRMLAIIRNSFD